MAIYPPKADPFECAICERAVTPLWESPAHRCMPPLCFRCEQHEWGAGLFEMNPDKRLAKQISALANALQDFSNQQIYGVQHGRA